MPPVFASPVAGLIRPPGSPFILGSFRVTAAFGAIDADHLTPHGGVDIGNGKCGEPLLAMSDAKITMVAWLDSPLGSRTALTVRGIDSAYPDHEWAIAHCATLDVSVNEHVTEGDRIGTLGKTGATSCHAHLGCKRKVNGVWVSIDIWPLFAFNQENKMPSFKSGGLTLGRFTLGAGHQLISPADTRQRFPQPVAVTCDVLAALDLKTPSGVAIDIDGQSPPLNSRDKVYLVDAPNFGLAAYALRQDGVFTPAVSDNAAEIAEQQQTINSQTARISTLVGAVSAKDSMLDAAILHEKSHVDLSAALQSARSR